MNVKSRFRSFSFQMFDWLCSKLLKFNRLFIYLLSISLIQTCDFQSIQIFWYNSAVKWKERGNWPAGYLNIVLKATFTLCNVYHKIMVQNHAWFAIGLMNYTNTNVDSSNFMSHRIVLKKKNWTLYTCDYCHLKLCILFHIHLYNFVHYRARVLMCIRWI